MVSIVFNGSTTDCDSVRSGSEPDRHPIIEWANYVIKNQMGLGDKLLIMRILRAIKDGDNVTAQRKYTLLSNWGKFYIDRLL